MIYLITIPKAELLLPITMRCKKKLHCEEYIEQVASKKLRKGVEDYNEMKFKPVEFDGFKRILKS